MTEYEEKAKELEDLMIYFSEHADEAEFRDDVIILAYWNGVQGWVSDVGLGNTPTMLKVMSRLFDQMIAHSESEEVRA